MSLNLLASYDSDESSCDGVGETQQKPSTSQDEDDFGVPLVPEVEEEEEHEQALSALPQPENSRSEETKSQKSFFSDDFASSSSDDEGASGGEGEEPASLPASSLPAKRLPSARHVLSGHVQVGSSVFVSETEREETERALLLSQHVALSEQTKPEDKHGRRKGIPCKAFRKGACRRGNKCRFSHEIPASIQMDDKPVSIESKASFYRDPNDVFTKKAKLA